MKLTQQEVKALLVRAFHTFLQAFLSVFLLGVTNVIASLASTQDFSASKSALIALVVAAVASGLSALKNAYVKPVEAL